MADRGKRAWSKKVHRFTDSDGEAYSDQEFEQVVRRRALFRGLQFGDTVEDFRMFRESAGFLLAVDQLTVDFDVEDSPAAFDEFGLNAELRLDRVRQTGGLGRVVSLYAILNRNVHVGPLIKRSWFAHACPRSFIP